MEHIIVLKGIDYEADKVQIEDSIGNKKDTVFLLDEPKTELCHYIDYLHEECGLKTKILHKLRICREFTFDGHVTLLSGEGTELGKPRSMNALLQQLQPGTSYRIVIENDDRSLLANIVQQLIYIDYPLTEVNMKLRREYKDAAKSERFMNHIDTLQTAAKSAVDNIAELCIDPETDEETKEKLYQDRALALTSYEKICKQIDKARDIEMKVAVAASKKTGKSVIVNCMLGMELAPTSLELATPNTCIYKKSPDNIFHLQMLDKNEKPSCSAENFDTAEGLHKRISKDFKEAQKDDDKGCACQDMLISYVSNGNNFESYTVYDTPGPDFAGGEHSAEKAINACDVAIFAIDYTKYLTTSEAKFLEEVKTCFAKKNKFHTLIFVINKIDQALNDKGTKSRVKSIDFIRFKLRQIDPKYGDCIVFATSAQDYFYSLELEKAATRFEQLSCLRDSDADLYQNLRPIKDELDADGSEDDLVGLLSNLDGEVGRIKSQLGYSKVDMRTLRHYSGIPQLMDYVSYIAKSKARDEIVNSITFAIDEQYRKLRAIINQISNMEELMGKTQEEIDHISAILDNYIGEVGKILNEDLMEKDLNCLNSENFLPAQISKLQKLSGGASFPIKLPAVLDMMRKDITRLGESEMQRELWHDFRPIYQERINKLVGKTVPITKLDIMPEEVKAAINRYLHRVIGKRCEDEKGRIGELVQGLKDIVAGRQKRVDESSERCKLLLEKHEYYLQLPEQPAFDVVFPTPALDDIISINNIGIEMSRQLKGVYPEVKGVEKFFRNIFIHWDLKYAGTDIKVKNQLSNENVKNIQGPFYDMLTDAKVYEAVRNLLEEVAQNVEAVQENVLAFFENMNDNCAKNIEIFKQGIDDRSYYEDRLEDYRRMKKLINDIQDASKDFLDIWHLVVTENNK